MINLPYKLLVFDWDGTLMDSEARIVSCLAMSLQDMGRPVPPRQALLNVIGLGLPEVAHALLPHGDVDGVRQFVDRYRYHFLSDHYEPANLFPGALDTLRQLDGQGFLLGVATGKGRRGLDEILERAECQGIFAVTRCADETASKPNPRMLMEVMDVAGVGPADTLMIGDTVFDMQLARNAGTRALGVSYGVQPAERLLAEGAIDCIDEIGAIVSWLANPVAP
ncbi:MAG: HAD-IA family hydrolase [Gammaproteobacteria bacterium]|jgi:phosphoglycolate phosphatase|nr:HAD-IA family hydrolase [Gammaproteobacteria bacterium]